MKTFSYGDEKIGEKELMITVASIVIGGEMLTFPAALADHTIGSDGVISIVVMGFFLMFVAWIAARLAARFPNQPFHEYASSIVTKPVAVVLTAIYGIGFLLLSSYVVRNIGESTKEYLLHETPLEVTTLFFLLVVIYAVASSRVGLIRLNMIFLPIIIAAAVLILLFNLKPFDANNLLPLFQTDAAGYIGSFKAIVPSLIGFEIILFYISFVKQPKKAPKAAAFGMGIPIVLYIFIFIMCIGVFGQVGTANLLNPTIELAKRVEIPGMILGRSESLFFVVWLMAIFTTAAMTFDIAVFAIQSLLKRIKKTTIIFVLAPIHYYITMLPKNYLEVRNFGSVASYSLVTFTVCVTVLLLVITSVRGVKGSE